MFLLIVETVLVLSISQNIFNFMHSDKLLIFTILFDMPFLLFSKLKKIFCSPCLIVKSPVAKILLFFNKVIINDFLLYGNCIGVFDSKSVLKSKKLSLP